MSEGGSGQTDTRHIQSRIYSWPAKNLVKLHRCFFGTTGWKNCWLPGVREEVQGKQILKTTPMHTYHSTEQCAGGNCNNWPKPYRRRKQNHIRPPKIALQDYVCLLGTESSWVEWSLLPGKCACYGSDFEYYPSCQWAYEFLLLPQMIVRKSKLRSALMRIIQAWCDGRQPAVCILVHLCQEKQDKSAF